MFAKQNGIGKSNVSPQQISPLLPSFALLAALFIGVPCTLAQQQPAQSQPPAAPPAQTTAPTQVPAEQPT